ncbi:MAG TPA: sigma-70 family RNA polymerase sigma factor [Cyclobacteriaceae bacterium]|nr:sigma-70 family RNA polymerase sigma factor [Cyclobacteriaceae bacterium]
MLEVDTRLMEEEAIRKSVKNPEAFKSLYEAYFKKIFLFVFHRVGDKETTADITQQVFLNALSNISRYQFRGLPFSSWLFRIAVNQCNDYFRKNKKMRMVVLEDPHIRGLYDDLTAEQSWDEWERKLPGVLEQLDDDDLQLIELRYFEQRPFKEVSEILGITESNTKVRTYRILERMKKIFLQQK